MSVSVEKTSNLGRRLTIEVPAEQIQQEESNRLKDLSKNMRVDGFRSGKVPANFIKQKYGKEIRSEAVNKVLETSLGTALKEHNLRPANRPNIEDVKDDQGKNLTYTVSFEIFPEIDLDFAKIELEKEVADITESDIDSGVKKLQDQFATWVDVVGRPAKEGDKLTIDFVGLLDDVPFANGSAENFDLELGSKRLIPGFEEGLVGATADSDQTLKLKFPADYGAADLAGKEVQFNVNVKRIQEKVPAEVNEEFAKRIGIEDKDVTKVRAKIKENMAKYLDDVAKTKLRDQAIDQIYKTIKFEVPASLVEQEKHSIIHEKLNKAAHDHDHTLTAEQDVEFTQEAQKRVAVGLLLNEIIVKHDLKPEEERILAKIKSMSLMYGGNAELIHKMYYESKEMRQNLVNMVLTDQAADLIVNNATIKEKKLTFYGIVDAKSE